MRFSNRQNFQKQQCKWLKFNWLLLPLSLPLVACTNNNLSRLEAIAPSSKFNTVLTTNSSIPQSGIDPERIIIPIIDVNAKVIDLGLNPDGTLEVPENYAETGWWTGGSQPGEKGPAVIVGHVDSKTNPAVFYELDSLMSGDLIQVVDNAGRVVNFEVERLKQVPKDNFPTEEVYGMTNEPTLRLVTCGGEFNSSSGHYLDNVIVFASLADR